MIDAALLCLVLAQQPTAPPLPPVRPIGPIEHVTRDSLASVTSVVPTSGGRVFVNDIVARRVLLYDSTLTTATVVADSTGTTANAYGSGRATMLPWHGDSALLITPGSLSMLVLSPAGAITRTLAMPPIGPRLPPGMPIPPLLFISALFDGTDHLVFTVAARNPPPPPMPPGSTVMATIRNADSTFLARYDLRARQQDTIASLRAMPNKMVLTRTARGGVAPTITVYPAAVVDDWTVLGDGTIAVVRGRDYHVDWIGSDKQLVATPRVAFGWEHLDDDQKRTLLDSAVARQQAVYDSVQSANAERAATEGRGRAPARAGGAAPTPALVTWAPADVSDVPDYRPAFRSGATRADADGNLWILTTLVEDARPVYDVVSRKGELVDRVQLPNHRQIAGFGPSVVYLSVLDSNKVAHLERARIH